MFDVSLTLASIVSIEEFFEAFPDFLRLMSYIHDIFLSAMLSSAAVGMEAFEKCMPASGIPASDPPLNDSEVEEEAVGIEALVKSRFQELIASDVVETDTMAVSDRVKPIKDVLNVCFHLLVTALPPESFGSIDIPSVEKVYLDPAIALILEGLEAVKDNVKENPDKYRRLLADLSSADRHIYDETFGKSINRARGGNEEAYHKMVEKCAALEANVAVGIQQPTKSMMVLVLLVRQHIPNFKTVVGTVVDAVGSSAVAIKYREKNTTKAPYRILEKALVKGPNQAYPDCSKVFDVFGCIVECPDYEVMGMLVEEFKRCQLEGRIQIVRMKERWSNPSDGGWRDLMLNLLVDEVVFEVQIVLRSMLTARAALDAHQAYSEFRSFAEVFTLLGLSPKIEDDGGDVGTINDVSHLKIVVGSLRGENSMLKNENSVLVEEVAGMKEENDSLKEEIVRLKLLLEKF